MLIITRKLGEKITIGDDIVVTLTHIERHKVRLGVDAPRSVPIYRNELLPLKTPYVPVQNSTPRH